MVYLLQQTGLPYSQKFSYYHYGPYSAELRVDIDRLIDHKLLKETYSQATYAYKITGEGNLFLQKYKEVFDNDFDLPQDIVRKLVKTDTPVLEMASTYVYLLEMGYQQQDAKDKAIKLKPHLKKYFDKAQDLWVSIQ